MKKSIKVMSCARVALMLISVVPAMGIKAADNSYSSWVSVFDPKYYNANNAAAAAYANGDVNKLWQYFLYVGISKCDQASEEFNVLAYANNYPELVKLYGNNPVKYYIHYATTGKAAGLKGTNATVTGTNTNVLEVVGPNGSIKINSLVNVKDEFGNNILIGGTEEVEDFFTGQTSYGCDTIYGHVSILPYYDSYDNFYYLKAIEDGQYTDTYGWPNTTFTASKIASTDVCDVILVSTKAFDFYGAEVEPRTPSRVFLKNESELFMVSGCNDVVENVLKLVKYWL